MSRVFLGACLVLLALSLVFPYQIAAQQEGEKENNGRAGEYGGAGGYGGEYGEGGEYGGAPKSQSKTSKPADRERDTYTAEEIKAALDSPLKTPLQYEDQPLNEVIHVLQEEYELPFVFDNAALEEVAISPETEITVNLRNISLRSALKLILRQPGLEGLTFIFDNEVLLITTKDKANENLVVQVYRVDDLIKDYSQQPGGNKKNPYHSLVQTIAGCVQYDSWAINGSGEGAIQLMQPGILVVTQTHDVHDQVQDLLEKIRAARTAIDQSSHGGGNF